MSHFMVLGYPPAGLVQSVSLAGNERSHRGSIHGVVDDVVTELGWTDSWSDHDLPVCDGSPACNVYADGCSEYGLPLSGEVFNFVLVEDDSAVSPGCPIAEKVACHQQMSALAPVPKPKSLIEQMLMSDDVMAIFSGSEMASEEAAVVPDCDDSVLDLLDEIGGELDDDIIDYTLDLSKAGPVLPTVSTDDVDSILSTFLPTLSFLQPDSVYPPSPVASPIYEIQSSSFIAVTSPIGSISPPYSPNGVSSPGSLRSPVSPTMAISARYEPYPGIHPVKRARKKEQNKSAALRYRQKKRDEQGSFQSEYDGLERRNVELKSRVEELTKQLNIVRSLVSEILQ